MVYEYNPQQYNFLYEPNPRSPELTRLIRDDKLAKQLRYRFENVPGLAGTYDPDTLLAEVIRTNLSTEPGALPAVQFESGTPFIDRINRYGSIPLSEVIEDSRITGQAALEYLGRLELERQAALDAQMAGQAKKRYRRKDLFDVSNPGQGEYVRFQRAFLDTQPAPPIVTDMSGIPVSTRYTDTLGRAAFSGGGNPTDFDPAQLGNVYNIIPREYRYKKGSTLDDFTAAISPRYWEITGEQDRSRPLSFDEQRYAAAGILSNYAGFQRANQGLIPPDQMYSQFIAQRGQQDLTPFVRGQYKLAAMGDDYLSVSGPRAFLMGENLDRPIDTQTLAEINYMAAENQARNAAFRRQRYSGSDPELMRNPVSLGLPRTEMFLREDPRVADSPFVVLPGQPSRSEPRFGIDAIREKYGDRGLANRYLVGATKDDLNRPFTELRSGTLRTTPAVGHMADPIMWREPSITMAIPEYQRSVSEFMLGPGGTEEILSRAGTVSTGNEIFLDQFGNPTNAIGLDYDPDWGWLEGSRGTIWRRPQHTETGAFTFEKQPLGLKSGIESIPSNIDIGIDYGVPTALVNMEREVEREREKLRQEAADDAARPRRYRIQQGVYTDPARTIPSRIEIPDPVRLDTPGRGLYDFRPQQRSSVPLPPQVMAQNPDMPQILPNQIIDFITQSQSTDPIVYADIEALDRIQKDLETRVQGRVAQMREKLVPPPVDITTPEEAQAGYRVMRYPRQDDVQRWSLEDIYATERLPRLEEVINTSPNVDLPVAQYRQAQPIAVNYPAVPEVARESGAARARAGTSMAYGTPEYLAMDSPGIAAIDDAIAQVRARAQQGAYSMARPRYRGLVR